MSTVTKRVEIIKQPRGGYLNPSLFEVIKVEDGEDLYEENIHPSIIGMVIDYMTRFLIGSSVLEAFDISIRGYEIKKKVLDKKEYMNDIQQKVDCDYLISQIDGLNEKSIIAACKLCSYDVWYRNLRAATVSARAIDVNPDNKTIKNISVMLKRSLAFWGSYGPVFKTNVTFENGGYTSVVDSGDGDFLTNDTLWDFKVSKNPITNKHTLQLLMYWIMGQHSNKSEFNNISRIGFYNPRLNWIYLLKTSEISEDIISSVEKDVLCYGEKMRFTEEAREEYFKVDNDRFESIKEINREYLIDYVKYVLKEQNKADYYYVHFLSDGNFNNIDCTNLKAKKYKDMCSILDEYDNYLHQNDLYEAGISIRTSEELFIKYKGDEYKWSKDKFDPQLMSEGRKIQISVDFNNKKIKKIVKSISYQYCLELKDGNIEKIEDERKLKDVNEIWTYHCKNNNKKVIVPSSWRYIGRSSFPNKNVNEIVIEDGVKEILDGAFCSTRIKSIDIPGSVKKIGSYAFSNCMELKELVINEGVKELSDHAFSDSAIEKIRIANSVDKIGKYAFSNCDKLTEIISDSSISKICQASFDSCSSLKSIKLSNLVESIGRNAFKNCSSLEKVLLPDGLKKIEVGAFSRCISLKEITIPESCEVIMKYAFECCENLKVIYAYANCSIDELAFIGMEEEPKIVILD